MKREQIITELERLASVLGVNVRYEKMGILSGGLCRINDMMILFINRALSPQSAIELIAAELRMLPWDQHFIKPEVREILEQGI